LDDLDQSPVTILMKICSSATSYKASEKVDACYYLTLEPVVKALATGLSP